MAICVISLLYFHATPVIRHINEGEQMLTFIRLGVAGRSATECNGAGNWALKVPLIDEPGRRKRAIARY